MSLPLADLRRRIGRSPASLAGLGLIAFFGAVALLAPVLAPVGQGTRDAYLMPQDGYSPDPVPPGEGHPFGTTEQQYDLYYGIVWGTRTAFKVGACVVLLSLLVGVALGALAGFYGGWLDEALMRLTDVILALPGIVLAVVVVTVRGPGLESVLLALALVSWPSYARLTRGDVLSVKGRDFVLAARALGAGDLRILLRHVLPNSVYPVLVVASLDVGAVVLTAASLSFLGLGAPAGYADWGQLVAMSRNWILGASGSPLAYWHTVVFPGAAIFLFVLGWNLLGDAFRDILDPRQR